MREIAGSGSTAVAPPRQNQSSGADAKSTPDTSPAKAWADALAQATANSPQRSVTAKQGDNLTGIANRYDDTLPSVEQANPQITNPNAINAGGKVKLPRDTPSQVVNGVDNSQIKPIITAMADANSSDQALHDLQQSRMRNRGLLGDALAQSAQSWDTVRQTTLDMLTNNNAGAYPEQAAAAEVRQLNALEPGNTKFAAANNAALAEATQSWTQMGVTKPQLSPIIDAYNNARQTTDSVNRYLQNPHLPHNRAITDDLRGSEQQASSQLNVAIEKSLTDAANQAGRDPKARSEAMTRRAANIQLAGPQDPAFQTAVDNANYDLQVNKPAQAVADAYAKGGAEPAAQALKTATQNAGNSYYAGQIIQQSQGTIDSITRDMGSLADNVPRPSRASMFGPTPDETKLSQIYQDLSQSVGAANTITTSGSLSPGGKAAAEIVGNSVAENAPKNLMPWQSGLYGNAAASAITNGDGAALTMATAAALKRQGNSDLASVLTEGAATGIQALQSKTNDDVTAFATTTNNLHQLRTTWGPFMTGSQSVNATNGYLADHPDVRQKADAQLGTISQDGDAIAEAESAWHSYKAPLAGIDGQGDLSTAAQSLTGSNASAAFAVSQSTSVNNAIAAALGPAAPSQGTGGSVTQALFASPVWSLPRSTRSFLNATYKTINAQAKGAGISAPHDQGKFTTLSTIGFFLTAENAIAKKGFPVSSLHDAATSTYTALGLVKYGGEIAAGLAKDGVFTQYGGKFGLSTQTLADLTKTTAGLTKTAWFKVLGSAYYGAGALASFLQAEDDFKNGDGVSGGLDIAEGVGNLLNAAKPLVPGLIGEVGADGEATLAGEAVAETVAAAGSGLGLLAVVGTLIYGGIKGAVDQQHYQEDSSKFLQQGLGLKLDVADALSAPLDQSDGSSASEALQAYARQYRVSPEQLLQKLNREPIDKVTQFINEAADMPKQSNGQYAASLASDDPNKTGTYVVWRNDGRGPVFKQDIAYQADSLRQLNYWADHLFGKNQVG